MAALAVEPSAVVGEWEIKQLCSGRTPTLSIGHDLQAVHTSYIYMVEPSQCTYCASIITCRAEGKDNALFARRLCFSVKEVTSFNSPPLSLRFVCCPGRCMLNVNAPLPSRRPLIFCQRRARGPFPTQSNAAGGGEKKVGQEEEGEEEQGGDLFFDSSSAVGSGRWPCADDAGRGRRRSPTRSASPPRGLRRETPSRERGRNATPSAADGDGASVRSGSMWGGSGKASTSPARWEDCCLALLSVVSFDRGMAPVSSRPVRALSSMVRLVPVPFRLPLRELVCVLRHSVSSRRRRGKDSALGLEMYSHRCHMSNMDASN